MELLLTNWSLIRNRYEFFGASAEEIADEFDLSPQVVHTAIKEQNWERKVLGDVVEQLNEGTFEDVKSLLEDKYLLGELMKDRSLQGKFHLLEHTFIAKAIEVIRNIEPDSNLAAGQIATLTRGLKTFYELSKRGESKSTSEDTADSRVVVNILAQA